MPMNIKFRPHHFMCALCFQGKGYSPAFVNNFAHIMDRLNENDQTIIEVVAHTDDICSPCPSKRDLLCETQSKIEKLDQKHAKALALNAGDKLTWREAKTLIADKIDLNTFDQICQSCSWKSYGICEKVITQHYGSTQSDE